MFLRALRYPYANTRARAIAASFLKPGDFASLSRLRIRDEVIRTLSEKTIPTPVTAEEIEEALRGNLIDFGRGVGRSLPGAARRLIEAYLQRNDFENLKIVCRRFFGDQSAPAGDILLLPAGPGSPLPSPARLQQIADLEELVELLPREPFRQLLQRALDLRAEERLYYLETKLDCIFWERLYARVAELPRFDRQAALEILGWRADLDRFNLMHRRWRFGLADSERPLDLPPMGTLFPEHQVKKALRSDDPEKRLCELFPEPEGNPLSISGEIALADRLYRKLWRIMRSHPFDISVPLAAVLLKELECRNLVAVLEGLRFARPAEQILPFLAGGE